MDFVSQIREKAKYAESKKILFPEGEDPRILEAVKILKKENLVDPVILGKTSEIKNTANQNNIDLTGIEIIDPSQQNNVNFDKQYYELRKHKGLTEEQAFETMQNPLFYAAMMIRTNLADGALAGAANTTGSVLKAAIQVIGLAENSTTVSSCFFMIMQDGAVLTYGDCALIQDPYLQQLANIAISTAEPH